MPHHVLLIVNPTAAAGRAGRQAAGLLACLNQRSLAADHVFTERPRHAVELARQAADRYDVIAAVGGDGTVNEVATGILLASGPRPALGVVPLGTGNDFAYQVGIRSVKHAIHALVDGKGRALDVIEVSCREGDRPLRHFAVNHVAVGFASALVRYTTPAVKRVFGPRLCYTVGFLRAIGGFHSPFMRVSADGQSIEGSLFHVCAGNSEWSGGGMMRLSPGAKMDDGQLDICLIEALGRLETLRCFPRLLKGTHVTHPKVRYFRGRTLRVDSDPPADLQMDGDLIGRTPATFQIQPGAIRVLTPPVG
jgi:YegS/Rv2252/BmrU family lipid kinase